MPPCSVWGHPKVTMCCDEDSEARNWALQGGDRAVGTPPGAGPYPPPARFQFRSLLKVAGASRCSMKTNTVTSGHTGKEGSSVFLTNKIFWLTHVLTEDTAPDVTPQGKCMATTGRVRQSERLPHQGGLDKTEPAVSMGLLGSPWIFAAGGGGGQPSAQGGGP